MKQSQILGNAQVYGNARVFGDALVYGNAQVYGNAWVYGNAQVSGDALIENTTDYIVIGPAKSSGRCTTAHKDLYLGIRVNTGCFSGSLEEFEAAINKTHAGDDEFKRQYLMFVSLIKDHFNL